MRIYWPSNLTIDGVRSHRRFMQDNKSSYIQSTSETYIHSHFIMENEVINLG